MRLVSIVLLFTVYSLSEALWCPDGASRFPGEYTCFLPVSQAKNYQNAKATCESMEGVLAKIANTFENTYLTALISPDFKLNPPYIGIVRGTSGWVYSDGTPIVYTNWNPGESTKPGDCAFLDPKTVKWNNTDCSNNRPFFCTFNGIKNSCPYNWIYNRENDYCYYLQDFEYVDGENWKVYNFSTAEYECQQMAVGSHLVSIHSSTENTLVSNLISSNAGSMPSGKWNACGTQYAWIGYTGNGTLYTGNWTDGSDVDYLGSLRSTVLLNVGTSNDPCCASGWRATAASSNTVYGRFVCKKPSVGFSTAIQKERMASRDKAKAALHHP